MKKRFPIFFVIIFFNILFIILGIITIQREFCTQKYNLFKTKNFLLTKVTPVAFSYERGKPIDRYYIENFLDTNKQYIKGHILEMEDNEYTYVFGSSILSSDILDISKTNKKATIVHDLQDSNGFPSEKFDCYICTQTLQYLYDIKTGFSSAKKMLKKGGVFLVTVPGISQLSYKPGEYYEYWHFTEKTLSNLAKDAGFRKIKVHTYGNALAASAFIQGVAVDDLKDKKILDYNDNFYPVTVTLVAIK